MVGTNVSMSTPTAILLGSVIVAAAVLYGRGAPEAGPVSVPSSPAPERAPIVHPAITPRETVVVQAEDSLKYQRAGLRARCPARPGESYRFTLDVTFDPGGNEVIRGIIEDTGNPATGMGTCLTAAIIPLKVPPPGVTTRVEVPLLWP